MTWTETRIMETERHCLETTFVERYALTVVRDGISGMVTFYESWS